MDAADLAFAGLARQAERIRACEVSSRELTQLYHRGMVAIVETTAAHDGYIFNPALVAIE